MANRTFAIIISLLSMLVADVLAFPQGLEDRGLNPNACKAVDGIVTILHANAQASSFCSSVLEIQTVTVSSATTLPTTVTVSTVTPLTTTSQTTTTSTTVTTTVTSTVFATTSAPAGKKIKRDIHHIEKRVDLLVILEKFAAKDITSACQCLNLPTPTATTISTVTQTASVTATAPTSTITSISTTTSTFTTTTTTTTTSVIPQCSGVSSSSLTVFNVADEFVIGQIVTDDTTAEACCIQCWTTPNCGAWDIDGTRCFVSVISIEIADESPTAACPIGRYKASAFSESPTSGISQVGVFGPCAGFS